MRNVSIRQATTADLPLIGMLCARSVSVRSEGIGYPRCADETEFLTELALYDLELEENVLIICDEFGAPIGCTGFLVSDTDAACYLIGPLLLSGARTVAIFRQALELAVTHPVAGA